MACAAHRSAIGQENGAITGAEEFRSLRRSCEGNRERMSVKGTVKEFVQFAKARGGAGVDRDRPKGTMRPHGKFQVGGLVLKALNVDLRSSREEENLIEIALANGLGIGLGKTAILDELAVRK